MSERRLVAVLGYSNGKGDELHAVCTARLERAAKEVRPDDAVLLSGWARRRRRASEAELMADAWSRPATHILVDRHARSTLANAVATAKVAAALSTREVVLVTSSWHGRRAAALAQAALDGLDHRLVLCTTNEQGSLAARLRELACWVLVPFQARLARRAIARST